MTRALTALQRDLRRAAEAEAAFLERVAELFDAGFDTLAIVDTGQSPSLREAGFVADQVRRYNTVQQRRVRDVRDRFARRGASFGPVVDLGQRDDTRRSSRLCVPRPSGLGRHSVSEAGIGASRDSDGAG